MQEGRGWVGVCNKGERWEVGERSEVGVGRTGRPGGYRVWVRLRVGGEGRGVWLATVGLEESVLG